MYTRDNDGHNLHEDDVDEEEEKEKDIDEDIQKKKIWKFLSPL